MVTFDPHPQEVLRGETPCALVAPGRKIELLETAGIEQLVVLRFDRVLSLVEPEEFIDGILVGRIGARAVVVGSAFRFGHRARGDVAMLRLFGRRLGYSFSSVRLAELHGRTVSSTEVRYALARGDLVWANRALGRPHRISGVVVKGTGRGRRLLGFPTANVRVDERLCLPALGIYAGTLANGSMDMPAALSVGTNPQFGKNPLSVEAFVLDFEGDLYGARVEVSFVERLRDEAVFPDEEGLAKAIARDVETTRRVMGGRRGR